jgi:hypothetical protein
MAMAGLPAGDEVARCKEAMEGCPVEAIGNNGYSPPVSFKTSPAGTFPAGFFIWDDENALAWKAEPPRLMTGTANINGD